MRMFGLLSEYDHYIEGMWEGGRGRWDVGGGIGDGGRGGIG